MNRIIINQDDDKIPCLPIFGRLLENIHHYSKGPRHDFHYSFIATLCCSVNITLVGVVAQHTSSDNFTDSPLFGFMLAIDSPTRKPVLGFETVSPMWAVPLDVKAKGVSCTSWFGANYWRHRLRHMFRNERLFVAKKTSPSMKGNKFVGAVGTREKFVRSSSGVGPCS